MRLLDYRARKGVTPQRRTEFATQRTECATSQQRVLMLALIVTPTIALLEAALVKGP
jgi:hypothetical protein